MHLPQLCIKDSRNLTVNAKMLYVRHVRYIWVPGHVSTTYTSCISNSQLLSKCSKLSIKYECTR